MPKNKYVLSLRPLGRSEELNADLINLGYNLINIPCLEILPITSQDFNSVNHFKIDCINSNIDSFDIFIFISVNAVNGFINLVEHEKIPDYKKVIAIGSKTAKKLRELNFENIIHPQEHYQFSEDLVKLPELADNLSGKKILLIRGDVSREYIANDLKQKQAKLTECIVYSSQVPKDLPVDLEVGLEFINNIDIQSFIILITSNSILNNFHNSLSLSYQNKLKKAVLLVPSARISKQAKQLGYENIIITNTMNNDIIKSIIENY